MVICRYATVCPSKLATSFETSYGSPKPPASCPVNTLPLPMLKWGYHLPHAAIAISGGLCSDKVAE